MFSLVFGEFNFCLSVVLDMMNEFEDEYGEFGGELFFGCDLFVIFGIIFKWKLNLLDVELSMDLYKKRWFWIMFMVD